MMCTPFQQGKQFFCDRGPHALDIYGNPYDFGHPDDLKTKSYQDFEDGFFEAFRNDQRDKEFEESINEAEWLFNEEDWVVEYLKD